ncbi:histidinol-phosphate transaminase [Methanolapillus ohkumae]|uniref:Histidinol-phosphate aminotransferase n=1 Tax=Methanolapillus ohkumae TaxID=3028298 RepID=A0AA96V669_9EURY|nr:Histidinol-phosphate aminotransferase [Methanosarcinaceae archaeon Am2]
MNPSQNKDENIKSENTNSEFFQKRMNKFIASVPEYVPGKSTAQIVSEYGLDPKKIIKLNSNENPLGPSKKVQKSIQKNAKAASLYPIADASDLRTELSKHTGLPKEKIMAAGPGMDSIIDGMNKLFAGPGDEVIVPVPTFTYYGISASAGGANPIYVGRKSDYSIDLDKIKEAITPKTKIIYVCTPNNPTGNIVTAADVEELAQLGCILFLDEAYVEFSDFPSLLPLVEKYENIVVGRTFSKAFGLAGMRIGYAAAPAWIIQKLLSVIPPFSVSTISEIAAIAALSDSKHLQKSIKTAKEGRQFLQEEIASKTPYKSYPSNGNFIIVDVSPKNSKEAVDFLLKKGIIVRSCDSFDNIGKNTIRITIGTRKMNQKVIDALKQFQ